MPGLTFASLATPEPMGQQAYESAIIERAPSALDSEWNVQSCVVRTLRSDLPGTARLPAHVLYSGGRLERTIAGRFLYRGAEVVHRLDLRLPPSTGPEVLTIHDIVSWRFPDEAAPPSRAIAEARQAQTVICPSQFSADEVESLFGLRHVHAIPNGIDPGVTEASPLTDLELRSLNLQKPFVLHTGGCSLRKNLAGLAEAWQLVRRAYPSASLALVGPSDPRRDVLFRYAPGAVRMGRLPTDLLHRLRATAAAIVIPSIYEGFGLPAAEGMAAGVPVVAARRSSLPEVCGDGAVLVEPTGRGIADGLVAVLEGGAWMHEMLGRAMNRAANYTWDVSAAQHAALWNEVAT